jgi:hypothetical protein
MTRLLCRLLLVVSVIVGLPATYAASSPADTPPPTIPEGTIGDVATDDAEGAQTDAAEAEGAEAEGVAISAIVGAGVLLALLAGGLLYLSSRRKGDRS